MNLNTDFAKFKKKDKKKKQTALVKQSEKEDLNFCYLLFTLIVYYLNKDNQSLESITKFNPFRNIMVKITSFLYLNTKRKKEKLKPFFFF